MNLESKYSYVLGLALSILLLVASCETKPPTNLADHNLIPHPVEITSAGERFLLGKEATLQISDTSLQGVADYLLTKQSKMQQVSDKEGDIVLSLDAKDEQLGEEGYLMNISENQITISANHAHGVFHGLQTLLQLIPVTSVEPVELATGAIRDYPRYEHRGSMLDVSRHFFGVQDVKRYIDFLAAYKINVLHLHLTDDQGWRIEIKSKPELTAIGGSTEVGGGAGGFYTQEQYQDIVQYAADRFITIVPEIDLPGHTQAALASYPELNCDGKAGELYTGTKVGFSTLCTDNEATYEFVDDVVKRACGDYTRPIYSYWW